MELLMTLIGVLIASRVTRGANGRLRRNPDNYDWSLDDDTDHTFLTRQDDGGRLSWLKDDQIVESLSSLKESFSWHETKNLETAKGDADKTKEILFDALQWKDGQRKRKYKRGDTNKRKETVVGALQLKGGKRRRKYRLCGCRKSKIKSLTKINTDGNVLKTPFLTPVRNSEGNILTKSESTMLFENKILDSTNESDSKTEETPMLRAEIVLGVTSVSPPSITSQDHFAILSEIEPEPEPTAQPILENTEPTVKEPSETTITQHGSETETQPTVKPIMSGTIKGPLQIFPMKPGLNYRNLSNHYLEPLRNAVLGPKLKIQEQAENEARTHQDTLKAKLNTPWFPLQELNDDSVDFEHSDKAVATTNGVVSVNEATIISTQIRDSQLPDGTQPAVQGSSKDSKTNLCKVLVGCLFGMCCAIGLTVGVFLFRRRRKKKNEDKDTKMSEDAKDTVIYVSVSSGTLTKQNNPSEKIGCEQDNVEPAEHDKTDQTHVPPSYESAIGPPTYLEVIRCEDYATFEQYV